MKVRDRKLSQPPLHIIVAEFQMRGITRFALFAEEEEVETTVASHSQKNSFLFLTIFEIQMSCFTTLLYGRTH